MTGKVEPTQIELHHDEFPVGLSQQNVVGRFVLSRSFSNSPVGLWTSGSIPNFRAILPLALSSAALFWTVERDARLVGTERFELLE
jgi:hypothetical protein